MCFISFIALSLFLLSQISSLLSSGHFCYFIFFRHILLTLEIYIFRLIFDFQISSSTLLHHWRTFIYDGVFFHDSFLMTLRLPSIWPLPHSRFAKLYRFDAFSRLPLAFHTLYLIITLERFTSFNFTHFRVSFPCRPPMPQLRVISASH